MELEQIISELKKMVAQQDEQLKAILESLENLKQLQPSPQIDEIILKVSLLIKNN